MARTSKPPDERRHELLHTALQLFIERGYERTSVADIVGTVGVAQGTFYYYFRSKADVLDEAADRVTGALSGAVAAIVQRKNVDAVQRLRQVLQLLFTAITGNRKLIAFFRQPGNEVLHERVRLALEERLLPLLRQLVQQGVADGRFHQPYPAETAALMLAALPHLVRVASQEPAPEDLQRLQLATELSLLRALGVPDSAAGR